MRFDRGLIAFGLFLVVAGGTLLAVRQNAIPADLAERAWTLWPVLLIGWGLSLLLDRRPGAALGGLVVAVTFGLIVGGVVGSGVFPVGVCGDADRAGTAFDASAGDLGGRASVTIELACGDLEVGVVDGSRWSVIGTSADGTPPRIDASSDELSIESGHESFFGNGGPDSWQVAVPAEPTLDLDITTNAGDTEIDLRAASLGQAEFTVNAGSIAIRLDEVDAVEQVDLSVNAGSATIWLAPIPASTALQVNAGSISICPPSGVGIRIVLEGNATSNDFAAQGLVENGENQWETPGFSGQPERVELTANGNAASYAWNPARTCAG